MPRKPGIWLRKGTPWFYTTIGKEKVRLSKDRTQAQILFHRLMAKKAEEAAEPCAAFGPTFRRLTEDYLVESKSSKSEKAFEQQLGTLRAFIEHIGKRMLVRDLRPYHVSSWLQTKPTWGHSTQTMKRKAIKAVLNWAVREGRIDESPLKKMASGEAEHRDRVLTADERAKIRECVSPEFATFLRAAELTGARPFSELAQVTAASVNFEAETITLQKHKNRKKSGKPRTIYIVPELLTMLRTLVAEHPVGPLFRNTRGTSWTSAAGWRWFGLIKSKLGIDAFPYSYRHSYITDAIIRGVPVDVVAALVGNTPQMIWKHYSHVAKDQNAMKVAARKAVSAT